MYFVFLCFYKNEINIANKKKKETKKVNTNSFILFNFRNIFPLLTSRTEEIVW